MCFDSCIIVSDFVTILALPPDRNNKFSTYRLRTLPECQLNHRSGAGCRTVQEWHPPIHPPRGFCSRMLTVPEIYLNGNIWLRKLVGGRCQTRARQNGDFLECRPELDRHGVGMSCLCSLPRHQPVVPAIN